MPTARSNSHRPARARASAPGRNGAAGGSLGRVLDFMRSLWAVDHGLTKMSKRMQAMLGITGPQRLVIRIVGRHPGISAGELAAVLHVHPSTLTGVLRRLVARGVIERSPHPADTRRAVLRLTRAGDAIDALRAGTVEASIRAALTSLAETDVDVAARVLQHVARALDEASRAR